MGGAVTILGAIRIPELSAAVCFYGLPPGNVAKPADIRVPLQGHFANEDDWCTPKAVNDFEAALKAAGYSAAVLAFGAANAASISRRTFTARSPRSYSTSAQRNGSPAAISRLSLTLCARPSGRNPASSERSAGHCLPQTQ